jgi:hypothetical protein
MESRGLEGAPHPGSGWAGRAVNPRTRSRQWVATALVAGRVLPPEVTTAVVSMSAVARAANSLPLAYGITRDAE